MKVYYLMDYLPTRHECTDEQTNDRNAILEFKNGYCAARILTGIANGIRRLADSNTVVCFVPASTPYKTERRYARFANNLQNMTKVNCSHKAIYRTTDGTAGHIDGKSDDPAAEFMFDSSFFNGKKVLLIDDVITRGVTLESTARRLSAMGAIEVIGIAIGKTTNPNYTGPETRNLERL